MLNHVKHVKNISIRNQKEKTKSDSDTPGCAATVHSDTDPVFGMPIVEHTVEHRPKLCPQHVYSACVAKPITKKEAKDNPKAMAALDKEWNKLRNIE